MPVYRLEDKLKELILSLIMWSQGLNSDCQVWQEMPLPTEPNRLPSLGLYKSTALVVHHKDSHTMFWFHYFKVFSNFYYEFSIEPAVV